MDEPVSATELVTIDSDGTPPIINWALNRLSCGCLYGIAALTAAAIITAYVFHPIAALMLGEWRHDRDKRAYADLLDGQIRQHAPYEKVAQALAQREVPSLFECHGGVLPSDCPTPLPA